MHQKRLYVSGLWIVEGNLKRSPEHYDHYLDLTLKMIQGADFMFFYESPSILEEVSRLGKQNCINLLPVELKLEDHPNYETAQELAKKSCEFRMDVFADAFPDLISSEKGFNQYFRFINRGENLEAYCKQLVCALGKYRLVRMAMDNCDHAEFVWMDASASRFNGKREHSNFTTISPQRDAIYHYSSSQTIFGQQQRVQGSVQIGTRQAWEAHIELYEKTLNEYAESGCIYPTTDEPLLTLCHLKQPRLFERIDARKKTFLHKAAGRILSPFRKDLLIAMNHY